MAVTDFSYGTPLKKPLVTIIIPVYGQQSYLNDLVASINRSTYDSIEIWIVDDFSSPSIRAPESRFPIFIERNARNMGKAYSVNRGADLARGSYLIITDPDIEFDPDLILKWVIAAEKNNRIGVAGTYVYYQSKPTVITHAGALIRMSRFTVSRRLVNVIDDGHSMANFEDPLLVMDDVYFVRKRAWDEVGGLDDENFDVMFEEADMQQRIAALGYSLVIVAETRAYHKQDPVVGMPLSRKNATYLVSHPLIVKSVRNRLVLFRKLKGRRTFALMIFSVVLFLFYCYLILTSEYKFKKKAKLFENLIVAVMSGLNGSLVV